MLNVPLLNKNCRCHRRLDHANMELVNQLSNQELIVGLPKIKFEKDKICNACQIGKQTKSSFRSKNHSSSSRPFDVFHTDLFGPTRTCSLGGKGYALVIVDYYLRFTCLSFLVAKRRN